MTDKEYRDQKKRVQKYIDKWFTAMGLGWYSVDFLWTRERHETIKDTLGETTADWQYQHATIEWFLPKIATVNDDQLENAVVHEFVHVLNNAMWNNAPEELRDRNEYVTESIAKAFLWVRAAAEKKK